MEIIVPEWYRSLLAGAGARDDRPAWVLAGHSQQIGNGLTSARSAYNDPVGSFETRALVSARKFTELGAGLGWQQRDQKLPSVRLGRRAQPRHERDID